MAQMKYFYELTISSSPHAHSGVTTRTIMRDVLIALTPALIGAVYYFGFRALVLTLLSAAACVFFEWAYCRLMKKPVMTYDLSAVVTGVLLAFVCPVTIPYWALILGDLFAIVLVKQLFGGLGQNFVNPALAGRAFMLSWPALMTKWPTVGFENATGIFMTADAVTAATDATTAATGAADVISAATTAVTEAVSAATNAVSSATDVVSAATDAISAATDAISAATDAISAATPLGAMHGGLLPETSILDMFLGNVTGCLGETSAALLLIGFAYLLIRKVITARIPVAYIGTVAVLAFLFPQGNARIDWMLCQVLGGGLMLGAIFMATDYVTSPVTKLGQILFGVGCGVITILIRYFGGYSEGVSYAILVMNACVVLLDKLGRPVKFGAPKKEAAK